MSEDDNSKRELLDLLLEMPLDGDPKETMLTKKQRRFLRGFEPDLAASTKRSRRRGIRERIKNTWMESAIAFDNIPLEDSAQLILRRQGSTSQLQDYTNVEDDVGPPELKWSYVFTGDDPDSPIVATGGLRQVFGLGCLSLYEGLVELNDWSVEDYEEFLEALVAGAVRDTLAKYGRISSVHVDIEVGDERDELPTEIETIEVLRMLYSHREIDPQEFLESID